MRIGTRLLSAVPVAGLALLLLVTACADEEAQLDEFMDRGLAAVEAENDEEAIIEFRNVIQLDPNHADAHYELAKAYLRTKQLNDAYWELTESVRLNPDNTKARLSYGAMSLAVGEFREALDQADAVIVLLPDESGGYVLRGQALAKLDRSEEAEEPFLKALEVEPDDHANTVALAGYYHQEGRFEEAEPLYIKYTELEPGYRSYSALARFLVEDRNRDEDTGKAFQDAVDHAEDPGDRVDAYRNLAGFLFSRGRMDEAAAVLEEGIEKVEQKLELIYLLARFYTSQGDEERADRLVEQATEADADNPRTHLTLSAYRSRKGDMEGALAAAEAALAVAPDHLPSKLRKAELLVDSGYRNDEEAKVAQGRNIVTEVLAKEPSNPEALFVRAKIEVAEEKLDEAIVTLRACLDGRPDWAQAHFILGSALVLTEDYQGARSEVAKALELDAGLLDGRRLLAAVHSHLGEYEYAIEQGAMYLRERPDHVKTRILVAQSLMRLGRREEATQILMTLPDDKRNAEALYAIAKLQMTEKNYEEARELLLQANEQVPGHYEILKTLLGADTQLDRFDESRIRINQAVEADPENSQLVLLRANTEMVSGDLNAAERSYQLASDLDPENLEAYQQLAHFYRLVGRLDKAVSTLEDSLEARPDSAVMHQRLAVLYEMDGRIEDAKRHYERAIELDATLGESKNNLAYLLAEQGVDLERALDLAQEAKGLLPDSPNTADTLGWVLLKKGIPAAAIGYLRGSGGGHGSRGSGHQRDPAAPRRGLRGQWRERSRGGDPRRGPGLSRRVDQCRAGRGQADHRAQVGRRSPGRHRAAEGEPRGQLVRRSPASGAGQALLFREIPEGSVSRHGLSVWIVTHRFSQWIERQAFCRASRSA